MTKPALLLPKEWLSPCEMRRVVVHWTAGGPKASENDLSHYHFLVEGPPDFRVVRGTHPVVANLSTSDGDYAAHTKGLNTQSIGISACAMANAVEKPFNPGPHPLVEPQWVILAHMAAELCLYYRLALSEKTVLQHGEVQRVYGAPQSGKWDITKLPFRPEMSKADVGEAFRDLVHQHIVALTEPD
jgi:hypothetical protein